MHRFIEDLEQLHQVLGSAGPQDDQRILQVSVITLSKLSNNSMNLKQSDRTQMLYFLLKKIARKRPGIIQRLYSMGLLDQAFEEDKPLLEDYLCRIIIFQSVAPEKATLDKARLSVVELERLVSINYSFFIVKSLDFINQVPQVYPRLKKTMIRGIRLDSDDCVWVKTLVKFYQETSRILKALGISIQVTSSKMLTHEDFLQKAQRLELRYLDPKSQSKEGCTPSDYVPRGEHTLSSMNLDTKRSTSQENSKPIFIQEISPIRKSGQIYLRPEAFKGDRSIPGYSASYIDNLGSQAESLRHLYLRKQGDGHKKQQEQNCTHNSQGSRTSSISEDKSQNSNSNCANQLPRIEQTTKSKRAQIKTEVQSQEQQRVQLSQSRNLIDQIRSDLIDTHLLRGMISVSINPMVSIGGEKPSEAQDLGRTSPEIQPVADQGIQLSNQHAIHYRVPNRNKIDKISQLIGQLKQVIDLYQENSQQSDKSKSVENQLRERGNPRAQNGHQRTIKIQKEKTQQDDKGQKKIKFHESEESRQTGDNRTRKPAKLKINQTNRGLIGAKHANNSDVSTSTKKSTSVHSSQKNNLYFSNLDETSNSSPILRFYENEEGTIVAESVHDYRNTDITIDNSMTGISSPHKYFSKAEADKRPKFQLSSFARSKDQNTKISIKTGNHDERNRTAKNLNPKMINRQKLDSLHGKKNTKPATSAQQFASTNVQIRTINNTSSRLKTIESQNYDDPLNSQERLSQMSPNQETNSKFKLRNNLVKHSSLVSQEQNILQKHKEAQKQAIQQQNQGKQRSGKNLRLPSQFFDADVSGVDNQLENISNLNTPEHSNRSFDTQSEAQNFQKRHSEPLHLLSESRLQSNRDFEFSFPQQRVKHDTSFQIGKNPIADDSPYSHQRKVRQNEKLIPECSIDQKRDPNPTSQPNPEIEIINHLFFASLMKEGTENLLKGSIDRYIFNYLEQGDELEFFTPSVIVEGVELQVKIQISKNRIPSGKNRTFKYLTRFQAIQQEDGETQFSKEIIDKLELGQDEVDSKKLSFLMNLVKYQWILPCN